MGWPGQTSEHDADYGEANESGGGSLVALEVSCQAAVVADPSECAFDNPALGQDDEEMQLKRQKKDRARRRCRSH
jgi:hypothetical protein